MATQKTVYRTFKDSPEAWLQAAVDAKEITEAEREAIEKFLDAPTKAEAAKQMDVIRASMLNRPEFDLSQEERKELSDLADSLDTHRRQLNDDILRMSTRRQNLEAKGNNISQEEIEELGMIEAQLKSRQAELEQENRLYSTYLLIGALTTTEQAQQQANRWYEDIGREQGKNLLTAFSEYAQVAVHAIIPGHKEQVQDHLQKAEAASGRYQAAVARGFETQVRQMEPSRKERREDNKLTRQANKQIKKVQAASQSVKRWQDEAVRMANKIITTEYRQRDMFANIPGWSQGTPVNTTYQKITDPKKALEFLQEHGVRQASDIAARLAEAQERLAEEKKTLDTVMAPMLRKLDARQQALIDFKRDYEHAATHGHVGMQRADKIFEHVAEATKYAIFTPQFIEKLQKYNIQFDPKYQTIGAHEPQQEAPARRPFADLVQEAYQQASEAAAARQPAQAPRETDIPRVTPSAITRWDDYIAQTEKQNQPKCLCYRDKTGPHAIELDADPKKRGEQIERFKQDHGGDKVRFRILDEKKALEYLEIEGLKFRGARGLDKEHAQAWRQAVDKAYAPTNYPTQEHNNSVFQRSAPVAIEIAQMISNGATTQDILEYANSIAQQDGEKYRIDGAMGMACQLLGCESLTPLMEQIAEFRREQVNTLGRVVDLYPHDEQAQSFLEKFEQSQGHDVPGQEGQDQTDGIDDHDDHGPAMPGE